MISSICHVLSALGLVLALCGGTRNTEPPADISGRSAHWVIRATDLNATLSFLEGVLGMHTLRHEENAASCPITCNGAGFRPDNPWSKTMVGYAPEHEAFCLEVTFNYGALGALGTSGALGAIEIALPHGSPELALPRVLERARVRGLAHDTAASEVTGPDGYRFRLVQQAGQGLAAGVGTFTAVNIEVLDIARSLAFYVGVLGFHEESRIPAAAATGTPASSVTLRLQHSDARLRLHRRTVQPRGGREDIANPAIDGRHAISLPETEVRRAFAAIDAAERRTGGRHELGGVVHPLRELHEQLGMLVIAIVRDADGHEICLVSAETFELGVGASMRNPEMPQWENRAAIGREWMAKLVGEAPPDSQQRNEATQNSKSLKARRQ